MEIESNRACGPCELEFQNRTQTPLGDRKMITGSRSTFAAFMKLQAGVNEFTLVVE